MLFSTPLSYQALSSAKKQSLPNTAYHKQNTEALLFFFAICEPTLAILLNFKAHLTPS